MGAELLYALWETLYMVIVSTVLSGIFGSGVAILMIITGPSGLRPNAPLYRVLDVVVNLLRSFPFIILLIAIIPLTRIIVGTSIGSTASIVPLTIAATPFVARLMEGSLLEVDRGVVEAAKSFGASTWQIIWGVMIKEAMPSLVLNWAVVAINLLGYSAMAGVVGGGGLGDLAIKYGYNRFQTDVMIYSVAILIVVVQVIQCIGNYIYEKIRYKAFNRRPRGGGKNKIKKEKNGNEESFSGSTGSGPPRPGDSLRGGRQGHQGRGHPLPAQGHNGSGAPAP